MALGRTGYRGCLLGMAVGDAMGYTVDKRSIQEIRRDYGPNGLLGYDLANGYADVTSYTQIAAFGCNGLLIGVTRSRVLGKKAPLIKYIELSLREWAVFQSPYGRPSQGYSWLLRRTDMCRRHCMDTRMLDILTRPVTGTPEAPLNSFDHPGGITAALGVGLFFGSRPTPPEKVERLGGEAVALIFGSPEAWLAGEALTHILCGLVKDPQAPLKPLVMEAGELLRQRYGHRFSQAFEVASALRNALTLAESPGVRPVDAMQNLSCATAGQVLSGAIYACIASGEDFDRAMIIAGNHSGRSAAVGALAGAILGLRLGEEALPDFYIECLEPAQTLRELADDLYTGCPMEAGSKIFDLDWDYKYLHGGN